MKKQTVHWKRFFAILLSTLMLLSAAPLSAFVGLDIGLNLQAHAVAGYSAGGAAQWAKDHWSDHDSVLLGTGYWDDGGDCANFVSQCLYMGGIDMDSYWNTNGYLAHWTEPHGNTYAGSFIRCVQLYNFLVNQKGGQVIQNPAASQVEIGDVLIYYRPEVGRFGHSAIVADIIGGVPQIAYHSTGWNCDLTTNWHLGFTGGQTYLIKLHGSVCVNQTTRSFDVYRASGGDLRLYWNSNTGSGYRRTFLSGEYAHVYSVKTENGYTWGYTFRYGDWGWIKLNSFRYTGHYSTPSVSHRLGAWQTVRVANCQQDGLDKRVCSRCGYTENRTTEGGHVIDPRATCTTEGICRICGEVAEEPLGHLWDAGRISRMPTCTQPGDILYYCERDRSHTYIDFDAAPALGHDYQAVATAPTCLQDGITTYECSRCGDSYVAYTDPDNTWSGWTEQTPAQVGLSGDKVRSKQQWRSRSKSYTTSSYPELEGWTYLSTTTNYSDWSDWSAWSRNPVESGDLVDVETKEVSTTQYNYSRYWGKSGSVTYWGPVAGTWSGVYCGNYEERGWSTEQYSIYEWQDSNQAGHFACYNVSTNAWFNESTREYDKHTEYRSRTRTIESYTYRFYRWTDWSAWQDEEIKLSVTDKFLKRKEVEERTVYSYDLAALGHDFAEQSEPVYPNRDMFLTDEQVNDICYTNGPVCSRCGAASPESFSVPHDIPDFETERDQYEIVSGDDTSVTVYKGICRNGCGCYVLKTVENHNYAVKEIVPPTCNGENGTEGYTVYRCTVHGEEYNDDYVPALTDDYSHDVWEVETAPNCTEPGLMICKCARFDACGHYIAREIAPFGHTMTKFDARAATCLLDGNSEYWFCAACGKYFSDAEGTTEIEENSWVIPATGHSDKNDVEWTVETPSRCGFAGCERKYCENEWCDGIFECDICGETHGALLDERETDPITPDFYVMDAVDAVYDENFEGETDFDKWVSATCDHTGIIYITCRNCEGTENAHGIVPGEAYSTMEVRALPHTEVEVVAPEPLCVYPGEKHFNCSVCGKRDVRDPEIIPAPFEEHDLIDQQEAGGCIYQECSRCGYIVLGSHEFLRDPDRDIAPDCTERGKEAYTCSVCGMYNDTELDPLGHDMSKTGSLPATCCEGAEDTYACQRDGCDFTYSVFTGQPLGHDNSGGYTVTEKASCTDDGRKSLLCSRENARTGEVCGEELNWLRIPARGHNISEWLDDAASGADACRRKVCLNTENEVYSACSYSVAEEHDWGEWVTISEATYDDEGLERQICRNDPSHINERSIPVLTPGSKDNEDITVQKTADYDSATGEATISLHAESKGKTIKTTSVTPLDIVLVLDQSGSMRYQMDSNTFVNGSTTSRLANLKSAADSFVQAIYQDGLKGADHRIAVVGFAMGGTQMSGNDVDNVYKTFGKFENTNILSLSDPVTFDSTPANIPAMNAAYRDALVGVNIDGAVNPVLTSAINGLQGKGATAADYGLMMACKVFEQNPEAEDRRRVVVFMTDGEPTYISGFNDATAANAIKNARILKEVYDADVYSVGVFGTGISDKCRNFLTSVASGADKYYLVADKDAFIASFNTIAKESVRVETAFDDVTLIDTVSANFTLTSEQENALTASAVEDLGVKPADVRVTRRSDGTTEIRVSHIHPETEVRGEDTYFTIDFDFTAIANEKTITGGEYDTNTENAGIKIGDAAEYENKFTPCSVEIEAAEGVVYFNINGKPFHTVRIHAGETAEAPVLTLEGAHTFSGWDIPDPIVFEGGKIELEATLEQGEYTVTWNYGGNTESVNYSEGDIITVPSVRVNAAGEMFDCWDNEVPTRMPGRDLEFTALYKAHTHSYSGTVTKKPTCGAAGVRTYTCECGDSYEEPIGALEHSYITFATEEQQNSVSSFSYVVCENCGKTLDMCFEYTVTMKISGKQVTYDFKLTDVNNVHVQPDGKLKISLAVPDDMRGARLLNIYRIEEDGSKTDLYGVFSRGIITFETDHFSTYILEALSDCDVDGHNYEVTGISEATCTKDCYMTYTCSVCGDSYTEVAEKATGHSDPDGNGICNKCGSSIGHATQQSNCVCGKYHTGPFAWLVKFIHTIVYFFRNLFGSK